jgi:glutathione peroxidase
MNRFQKVLNLGQKIVLSTILLTVTHMANAACSELYNHQFTTLQGTKINLCDYQD